MRAVPPQHPSASPTLAEPASSLACAPIAHWRRTQPWSGIVQGVCHGCAVRGARAIAQAAVCHMREGVESMGREGMEWGLQGICHVVGGHGGEGGMRELLRHLSRATRAAYSACTPAASRERPACHAVVHRPQNAMAAPLPQGGLRQYGAAGQYGAAELQGCRAVQGSTGLQGSTG